MARRSASAAAAAAAAAARATLGRLARQLASDVRATPWREVAKELAPKKLWRDFRSSSIHTQAVVTLTCYSLTATGMMYGYLRYTQAVRRQQMAEVYRHF
mmetsp:Transcript_37237/g.79107  ORF Transcript_37237/g.79107 Transcript_37237/m.79107 type:complete len:100 (+) Transcript_37237:53-352(+)